MSIFDVVFGAAAGVASAYTFGAAAPALEGAEQGAETTATIANAAEAEAPVEAAATESAAGAGQDSLDAVKSGSEIGQAAYGGAQAVGGGVAGLTASSAAAPVADAADSAITPLAETAAAPSAAAAAPSAGTSITDAAEGATATTGVPAVNPSSEATDAAPSLLPPPAEITPPTSTLPPEDPENPGTPLESVAPDSGPTETSKIPQMPTPSIDGGPTPVDPGKGGYIGNVIDGSGNPGTAGGSYGSGTYDPVVKGKSALDYIKSGGKIAGAGMDVAKSVEKDSESDSKKDAPTARSMAPVSAPQEQALPSLSLKPTELSSSSQYQPGPIYNSVFSSAPRFNQQSFQAPEPSTINMPTQESFVSGGNPTNGMRPTNGIQVSDRRAKTNIKSAERSVKDFLSKLKVANVY